MTAKLKFSLVHSRSNLEPLVAEVEVTEGKPTRSKWLASASNVHCPPLSRALTG